MLPPAPLISSPPHIKKSSTPQTSSASSKFGFLPPQVCDLLTHAAQPLCEECRRNPQLAAAVLSSRASRLDRHHTTLVRVCLHCGGGGAPPAVAPGDAVGCDSLDCAVFFERRKTAHELAASLALATAGLTLLDG